MLQFQITGCYPIFVTKPPAVLLPAAANSSILEQLPSFSPHFSQIGFPQFVQMILPSSKSTAFLFLVRAYTRRYHPSLICLKSPHCAVRLQTAPESC